MPICTGIHKENLVLFYAKSVLCLSFLSLLPFLSFSVSSSCPDLNAFNDRDSCVIL